MLELANDNSTELANDKTSSYLNREMGIIKNFKSLEPKCIAYEVKIQLM